ncbi:predicted protein [Micromonas commoda]|uniref:Uncharacterized protein n=1 Tax=Micromonas commoda (strain RCC299 / NOUM17 / CCMP2709) TaxID=296587 RepID=C1EBT0_MICCC|nr:predicted protein [Micromonas commoda]ACO65776.1 predicted protein [Micromonas commoda]|eukprot:XP_002504518.1 predicted protein [Micromonas commoda]
MRRVGRLVRDLGLRARAARGARAPPPSAGGASRPAIRGAGGVGPVGTPTARSSAAVVLSMGFAASSIVAAAVGVASMDDDAAQQQTAFGENVSVDPATLRRLAADVVGADSDDVGSVDVERRRARALRILARVTLFLDHHDAIVAVPEVVDALIRCLERGAVVAIDDDDDDKRHDTVGPASTADAIRCLADLAKEPAVREAICASPGALVALAAAMDLTRWEPRRRTAGKGASSSSSAQLADVPGTAGVVHATRLAAELAGDPTAHAALIRADVPAAVVRAGRTRGGALGAIRRRLGALTARVIGRRQLIADGEKDAKARRSETTRNVAAFAYNLVSSSSVGREAFIATDGGLEWCRARALAQKDRVAHRYAVGALAVLAANSLKVTENRRGRLDPLSLRLALEAAVVGGLRSGDSQAACFACGMLREVAREGDEPTRRFVASLGAAGALLRLLGASEVCPGVSGWAAEEEVAGAPDASAAGRIRRRQRKGDDGARACALRALEAFALVRPPTSALRWSVLKAKNGLAVLAETADGTNGESASVRKLASDVLAALGK